MLAAPEAKSDHDVGPSNWRDIAHAKASQLRESIPKEWILDEGQLSELPLNVVDMAASTGLLTSREIRIINTETTRLVALLRDMTYSSHEVTLAFCKSASVAHQITNCLGEIFFDVALENAKSLDAYYQRTGTPAGPLHGLPVSLKDLLQVEGTDATFGFTSRAFKPTKAGRESELTKTMRQLGAILYCKTCVPVAMMSGETYNCISGYVCNPHNRTLSSGGSSGGEAALLAMKGSPLGIGSDIGGSLRIPAAFCGLYTLKPSFGRFPTFGSVESFPGQEMVKSVNGPMSASLSALVMWSQAVIGTQPWRNSDPDCIPLPWRLVQLPSQLCFGLVLDDGIVKPLPPVTRALKIVARALVEAGHRIIPVELHEPSLLDPYKAAMYLKEGAQMIRQTLEETNEPWPRGYEALAEIAEQSRGPATVSDLWKAGVQRTLYAKEVGVQWSATKEVSGTGREIDALITPCTPWAACKPYRFNYDNYTSLWNLLDYCASTIPITTVNEELDKMHPHEARNPVEAQIWGDYNPDHYSNAPVAVQLVGRRLSEEYLLEMTRICDEAVHGKRTSLRSEERDTESRPGDRS